MALGRSLFGALALHAGVALASRWAAGPERAPLAPPQSYEVSVVEVPEAPAPVATEDARGSGGGTAPAVRASRALGPAPRLLTAPAGDPAAPSGSAEAPSTAAAVDPPEVERPVDLGLGRIWLRPGLPDRRKKPEWSSGAQSAGGLGQALEARDQERGLGRGGVVATLARSAALGAGPQEGEATFLVMADRDGRVTSVSLSEDRGGWSAVTRALERSLAGKRLRVPPGANGLSVAVRVQAKVQLPSGSSPKHPVRGAGAGAEFDVADIGATPTRVVSARVTSERVL